MVEYFGYSILVLLLLGTYLWSENKWRWFTPSNGKLWRHNHQTLATLTEQADGMLTIHNIRDTHYISRSEYTPTYKDISLHPNDIVKASLYVTKMKLPAVHTFIVFELTGGERIAISAKMRRYAKWPGWLSNVLMILNPSELMYLIATERDVLTWRVEIMKEHFHRHTITLPQAELQAFIVDMLRRAQRLSEHPEFYSLFSNNCITNILNHVNRMTHLHLPLQHYSYVVTTDLCRLLIKQGLLKEGPREHQI